MVCSWLSGRCSRHKTRKNAGHSDFKESYARNFCMTGQTERNRQFGIIVPYASQYRFTNAAINIECASARMSTSNEFDQ